ncbi:MAG: GGDEF domain-containing protein [Gemmatimonadota bacterium]
MAFSGETGVADRKRAAKERGILLATVGWLLALAGILGLRTLGLVAIRLEVWVATALVTLALQGFLWLIPHRGWDARLSWDPHYVYLPLIIASLLLSVYVYLVPAAHHVLLMGWFVALLFLAGVAGLSEVVVLSGLTGSGHLAALSLRAGPGFMVSPAAEAARTALFFLICCYAGFVFRRIREDRRKLHGLRKDMAELANRDALTGLANRRRFERLLREELARAKRYGHPCTVGMVDVDHFKCYNDTMGHLAGDELLRELARVVQATLRDSDVVARYGGEEFALILVNTTIEEGEAVVERLRRIVEEHPFPDEQIFPSGHLTISAGIAECGFDGTEYEEVLELADRALYDAKQSGRNGVRIAA